MKGVRRQRAKARNLPAISSSSAVRGVIIEVTMHLNSALERVDATIGTDPRRAVHHLISTLDLLRADIARLRACIDP